MGRTDRVDRIIAASPERVYAALTKRSAIEAWLPPPGMSCTVMELGLHPGGRLRMVMAYLDTSGEPGKSTAGSDVVVSTIVDVVPGHHIVQSVLFEDAGPAYEEPMTMAWIVHPDPAGSRVEFRAENVPSAISAHDHRVGMTASLRQLAAYVG